MKTQLNAELALIIHPGIRALTRAVLDAAPDCFWGMPASTTGNHHPEYAQGEGGLIRHTRAVVRLTEHLCYMHGESTIPQLTKDCLIAAALLHDCCKKADHEEYTAFDHPLRVRDLIMDTWRNAPDTCNPAIAHEIAANVAAHMGRWNTNRHHPGIILPLPATEPAFILHTADYLASRADINLTDLA